MRLAAAACLLFALTAASACKGRTQRECRDGSACTADEYCEHSPGLCGRGKSAGACRPKPAVCLDAYSPVCGCDGKVYDSECAARAAGTDLAVMGGCKAVIADWIPCGRQYCSARTSYCEIYLSDVLEPPTTHSCRSLPPACTPDGGAARTCDCFPLRTPCLSFCGPMWTGGVEGFHLTCQGVKEPPG